MVNWPWRKKQQKYFPGSNFKAQLINLLNKTIDMDVNNIPDSY